MAELRLLDPVNADLPFLLELDIMLKAASMNN